MGFKWTCLLLATVVAGFLCWSVNDIRLEVRRTTVTVNDRLPPILDNSKETAEMLSVLAHDIRQVRELLGMEDRGSPIGLVAFANEVLREVESSGGEIGTKPTLKMLSNKKITDLRPAREWAVGARREAALQVLRVHSRRELLDRLCRTVLGYDWMIQIDDRVEPLKDWLLAQHPEWAKDEAASPQRKQGN